MLFLNPGTPVGFSLSPYRQCGVVEDRGYGPTVGKIWVLVIDQLLSGYGSLNFLSLAFITCIMCIITSLGLL